MSHPTFMPAEIKVPFVGEDVASGVLNGWRRKEGDWVRAGEILFEVETENERSEIYTNISGYFQPLMREGVEVSVGQVVARIQRGEPPVDQPKPPHNEPEPLPFSPSVRRMIAEKRLPAEQIVATGKGGRITKEDILRFEKNPPIKQEVPVQPSNRNEESSAANMGGIRFGISLKALLVG